MNRAMAVLGTCALIATCAGTALAGPPTQSITFAQLEAGSTSSYLVNSGSGSGWASSSLGTNGAVYPAEFEFNSASGMPTTLQPTPFNQFINANLSYSATTPAISTGDAYALAGLGGAGEQQFSQIVLDITANGAQTIDGIDIPNGALLLSMTAGQKAPPNEVGGILTGISGAHSATFSGGTSPSGDTIVFNSDYLDFTSISPDVYDGAYALSYSGLEALPMTDPNPGFEISGPLFNQYIQSFEAETTGTFSATLNEAPEPGVISMLGGLAVTAGVLRLRRRR